MGWFRKRKITKQDIRAERKVMALEKKHFGRWLFYHERQTKAYRLWLNANKDLL